MTITFIGHGYVGLVTACVFADLGNMVYVIGHTKDKIEQLNAGKPLIFEPGLKEILRKNLDAKRIVFTPSYEKAIAESNIVFLAVGTPPSPTGEADLSAVMLVAENIGKNLKKGYTVVSCKSTVPVGTNRKIAEVINTHKSKDADFDVASCPEFLREGSALNDTFHPDRIIIGANAKKPITMLEKLHEPLPGERVIVGLESAEIIKYASNSLLSTKISFANLISFICEKTGANVEEVLHGVGLDRRIGKMFLDPGVGYGGSCFPKDVLALIKTGEHYGVDMTLLTSVDRINHKARENFVDKILSHTKKGKVGIWGLAFKPNTDDIRFAPSLYVIQRLLENGYNVSVYDPEATLNVKKQIGDSITYAASPYDAAKNADAVIVITEWNEFKQIDLKKVKQLMSKPIIFDGRNLYDQRVMNDLGFTYFSVGR